MRWIQMRPPIYLVELSSDSIGGLVGYQGGGLITSSYATGDVPWGRGWGQCWRPGGVDQS